MTKIHIRDPVNSHPHRYFYLTVAFIEMSRASLPVTTMLALWVAQLETPTGGEGGGWEGREEWGTSGAREGL